MDSLKRTALYDEHKKLGGRLIDFGGWELPVQYSGLMDEHKACREKAGLFDVSHMGEVHVEGPDAEAYLNYLVTNNVSRLVDGQALYTVMCHEDGGIVDDLLIYRRSAEKFLVVINASNTEKDFQHMTAVHKAFEKNNCSVTNESSQYTQIAVQGRLAEEILAPLTKSPLSEIKYYHFVEGHVLDDIPAMISRTGYTGEDGFELYIPWEEGPRVWSALLENGQPLGMKPCGLGARDTLRMEVKFPLYGNELSDDTNPLETGLGWVVKLKKGPFVGSEALSKIKETGATRALAGIELKERGIPREGYLVFDESGEKQIGKVTSGTHSPSLGKPIGIALMDKTQTSVGTSLQVEIRGKKTPAHVIETPFYKRPY